jgi:hypothetical protein
MGMRRGSKTVPVQRQEQKQVRKSGVDWNRTSDLRLRSPSLYPLSYNPDRRKVHLLPTTYYTGCRFHLSTHS